MTQAPLPGEIAHGAGDSPGLPAGLLQPDAYPHPVTQPIRVIETHISWVLLTGTHAYKLKKPVRLPFLDYSTLTARRHCCSEEIRLNRRLAPELYLETVAIRGPSGSARVVPTGGKQQVRDLFDLDIIDYAVHMRQFDAGAELDGLLSSTTSGAAVGVDALRILGELLGHFHAAADPITVAGADAAARQVGTVLADNLRELAALTGDSAWWQGAIRRLTEWAEQTVAGLAPTIERRRTEGWTRDCHGDLHCGNIVIWQGQLTPFDCIDFDSQLRCIDIVNDLAFLTMDLAVRGHPRLRHAVLDSWCATTGDYLGLDLLPLYETGRAVVRSKVCALRAAQQDATGNPGASQLTVQARSYAQWALQRCQARPRPQLLVMCGLSGAGKTFIARHLAAQLHGLHIRSDVERKRLAGLTALARSESPPDGGIYTLDFNARTYQRLAECTRAALRCGENVIVDAACLRLGERSLLMGIGTETHAQVRLIHCMAPTIVLRQRIAARRASGHDASEATVELVDRQSGYWEPLNDAETARAIVVDTTAPNALSDLLARLNADAASR